jgi:hypothetical protein
MRCGLEAQGYKLRWVFPDVVFVEICARPMWYLLRYVLAK